MSAKNSGKQSGDSKGGAENPFKSSGGKSGDDSQKSLLLIAATAAALGLSLMVSSQPIK